MKVKKAFKKYEATIKTYVIKYCIPPDYETEYSVEKTGIYGYVRGCALNMAASGNCIILGIDEKESCDNREPII